MSHWSKIKEKKTSDRGLFFLFKIYEYLGVKPLKLALYPIIVLFFIIDSNIRKVSYKYLSYIYAIKKKNGEYFPTPTLWHVFKHIYSFADSLLDKAIAWKGELGIDSIQKKTNLDIDYLANHLQKNKGAFFICSHLGNIEILRSLGKLKKKEVTKKKTSITVIAQFAHSPIFYKFLQKINPKASTDIISANDVGVDTIIFLKEKIKSGGVIVSAGDRTSEKNKENYTCVDFLGHKAHFPMGSFILACLLKSPVYFIFFLKSKSVSGKYDLYLYKAKQSTVNLNKKERRKAIEKMTMEYVQYLQKLCLKYPYQWYNFYNFWEK